MCLLKMVKSRFTGPKESGVTSDIMAFVEATAAGSGLVEGSSFCSPLSDGDVQELIMGTKNPRSLVSLGPSGIFR